MDKPACFKISDIRAEYRVRWAVVCRVGHVLMVLAHKEDYLSILDISEKSQEQKLKIM